jgi:hypothetical protein
MTDLTLRRGDAAGHGLAALVQALREMFSATPLGILLAALRAGR